MHLRWFTCDLYLTECLCFSRRWTSALGAILQSDLWERAAGAGHAQQAPGHRRPAAELGELGAPARHTDSVRHRHGEPHSPGGRHRRADHGGRAEEDPWKFHSEGEDERWVWALVNVLYWLFCCLTQWAEVEEIWHQSSIEASLWQVNEIWIITFAVFGVISNWLINSIQKLLFYMSFMCA